MRMLHAKFLYAVVTGSLGGLCAIGVMLLTLSVGATEPAVPWECSGFAEESQNRCIRTFAELQQEKIAKLQKYLEVQQQTVQQLSNGFHNKEQLRLSSNTNLHTNPLAGMALLQYMSILPQASVFVLAETGFLAGRCIMEFPGTLVPGLTATDIVAGTITNLWGHRVPLVESNNFGSFQVRTAQYILACLWKRPSASRWIAMHRFG